MSFHDTILPKFISIFAIGSPQFSSSIASTLSGREIRNLDQEYARQRYIIKDCCLSIAEFEEFNAFFRARRGKNTSFRFRDQADCKVSKQIVEQQNIHYRSFQLIKSYDDQISPYSRIITKPVVDSVKIYLDNEIIEANVDYSKGIVKIDIDAKVEQILQADFTFDVMVRFAADSFAYHQEDNGSIRLEDFELTEVTE
ncbi:MAG: phage distal tail protein, Rcc01695 family [Janthinobacterium lividum]